VDGFAFFGAECHLPTWHKLVRRGPTIFGYMEADNDSDGKPDNWIFIGQ
jgi:hypothetical protein